MKIDPRLQEIKSSLYRIAVKALIVANGKVLLVKDKGDDYWSFPGGGVDYGESFLQALARELHEELGIPLEKVKTDEAIIYITIGDVVEGVPRCNVFYKVTAPVHSPKLTEHVSAIEWFDAEELNNLYLSPSTQDPDLLELVQKHVTNSK